MSLSTPSVEPTETGTTHTTTTRTTVADAVRPLVTSLLGPEPPVRIELWDGSALGPSDPRGTIRVRSVDALRRIMWSPDEVGLGRAYVAGDIDVDGDLLDMLKALRPSVRRLRLDGAAIALGAARRVGALGPPLPPPPEEAKVRGRLHSTRRDSQAVQHHYDVGNDFYRIVLGPAMTYSCARYVDGSTNLVEAQAAKHELVCRKLGLHERPGARLLDVGCGWGSMALHAATVHGASVVGVTISGQQAELARARVAEAGLEDRVDIRLQDYRDLSGERFDAISSIGMFEHVGAARIAEYFGTLRELLEPNGRLLNHAISTVHGSKIGPRTFMGRYVFPDAELIDVGEVALAMEDAGFEVRDVESLREHYARTLRDWIANLEGDWDRAVELAGANRARVWRLYMAGSAVGFEDGGLNVHQVLGVVRADDGASGMPPTRAGWE
jgi:cyclopropane-fatty-acyl-phospholipid synthase